MGSLSISLVLVLLLHVSWSFCSSVPPSSPKHLCLPDQRDALLQFKNSISIAFDPQMCFDSSPKKTDTWNRSIDCCSWEGVKCDSLTGHVIGINLTGCCLEGSLPANSTLFHLRSLQWLDLSNNYDLDGSFLDNNSSGLFHLHRLQRLNLAYNGFNGTISSELFTQLVSLTHLDLSGNQFSGFIPHQISHLSNLVSLGLSDSGLRFDAQDFNMFARNLTKLRNLVFDSSYMSNFTVASFINLPSSLETLSLRDCELHGEFPTQVFQLPSLKHIYLGGNENLTGYLPDTNLSSSLELLDLSGCRFRGSIPASLGNLTQIISIDLSENSFEGQIPDVFGNLTKLTSLKFFSCNFSGPLPITMFNLTKITHLDLSHNRLEGPLPNHVSELQFLEELELSYNSISGGVPSWLFTLPSLQLLGLSYNKLAGPIDHIQMPGSVQDVDLSYNDIDGPIPDSFFSLANLTGLDLSSNNLSGVIKSDLLLKLTSLRVLDVSNNSLLSLSTSGHDVNYSFSQLIEVKFSGCSVRRFPSFFQTSKLWTLDLSNNKISGGISKWEAQGWEELRELNISHNFLTTLEQIPGKYLGFLDLNSNLLQGPILSNLKGGFPWGMISVSDNKLTGNIPSSICNMSSLRFLDFSKNSLSGTLPDCLGNFSYSQFMNLQMNKFYGKIPDSFVMNNELIHLFLNDNQLEGEVPPSLANCTSLQLLNLGNNKLTDRFPHWLASLPSLQVLSLKSNRFHGSLPRSIASSNFSELRILDLSGNEFTGTLPTKLIRNLRAMIDLPEKAHSFILSRPRGETIIDIDYYYPTSVNVTTKRLELELTKTVAIFVSMDLSNNQFCGRIPEEVGQLVSLQMLNFSHNNFTGPIPASFGNLVAVESLDLSSNKLSGRIPSQLTKLTFLEVLNLSRNDLVGPIPHGNQFNTFDNDSYSGNLGLCGFPLSKQCDDHGGAEPPAPSVVEHEGSALPSFWKAAMMGYGSGVVLGVSLGYIVFTTGRPWWFVRMVERHLQYNFTNWMRRRNRPKRN